MRKKIMNWWWGFRVPLPVQLGFGRALCWIWGHEWTRYTTCDWCGKDKS